VHSLESGKRVPGTTEQILRGSSGEGTKLSTFRKFFTSGRAILEKSGPAGKEMSKVLETQRLQEDLLTGEYVDTIKQALKGIDEKERDGDRRTHRGL
jgi:hypothetical protein